MKTYVKESDTCGCRYLQTYDPATDTWGSVESHFTEDGRGYLSRRCDVHATIPFDQLNDVLMTECRRRNLMVARLAEHEQLAHLTHEDLMARCAFTGGDAIDRVVEFTLPELSSDDRAAIMAEVQGDALLAPVVLG